jgi:heme-degrading monooxygenase HmoA
MNMIAKTPAPPYYAVIFTSVTKEGISGYEEMANFMIELASQEKGFLGVESARDELGITVSYWKSIESIKSWKVNSDHQIAQLKGKLEYYKKYRTRICKVERDYSFEV